MDKSKIKFCKMGDQKIAIGTGKRPIQFCRECYVAVYGDQFEQWAVTVPDGIAIACAKTGQDIEAGGTVWLDPVETNIPALVYQGFIAPIQAPKASRSSRPEPTAEAAAGEAARSAGA